MSHILNDQKMIRKCQLGSLSFVLPDTNLSSQDLTTRVVEFRLQDPGGGSIPYITIIELDLQATEWHRYENNLNKMQEDANSYWLIRGQEDLDVVLCYYTLGLKANSFNYYQYRVVDFSFSSRIFTYYIHVEYKDIDVNEVCDGCAKNNITIGKQLIIQPAVTITTSCYKQSSSQMVTFLVSDKLTIRLMRVNSFIRHLKKKLGQLNG
ncbi:hypothetical protein AGLY_011900 [Aphis glycines]|uniref:Uncharacterized protein n=1 Tax=Aphis glycines TaxID=307491 RepID=A0A6G0TBF2_APHGL|nr:hypothetical protein AGLY_011900 [Aphis glycines]